jgi:Gpi18-like mannosyltransferase
MFGVIKSAYITRSTIVVTAIIIFTVALRGILAIFLPTNYDAESYEIVVSILKRGGNVYAETHRYNYSPVWFHTLYFLDQIRGQLPLIVVVRSFIAFFDTLNALVIGSIAARIFGYSALYISALYLLNAGVVALIGIHGQFEPVALFPLLLAFRTYINGRELPVAFYCALSFVIKQNTIFIIYPFLILTFPLKRAFLYLFGAGLCFLVSFLPHLEGIEGIIRNVLLYGSAPTTPLAKVLPSPIHLIIMLITVGLLPLFLRYFIAQRRGLL